MKEEARESACGALGGVQVFGWCDQRPLHLWDQSPNMGLPVSSGGRESRVEGQQEQNSKLGASWESLRRTENGLEYSRGSEEVSAFVGGT